MTQINPAFTIVPNPWGVDIVQGLGRGWVAVYHIPLDRRRINSVTIAPMAQSPTAGTDTPPPSGELTTRMLRSLAPASALAYATARWHEFSGHLSPTMPRYEQLANILGPEWIEAIERLEPGATGRSELRRRRLAAMAALYVAALQSGDRTPVATVAANLGLTQSKVRDSLYAARHEGLLELTGRGRAGGELTQAGAALLEKEVGWRGEVQSGVRRADRETPRASATRSQTPRRKV